jgi:hypothetical protein
MTTEATHTTRNAELLRRKEDKTRHKFLTRIPFLQLDPYHEELQLQPIPDNTTQDTSNTQINTEITEDDNTATTQPHELRQKTFATLLEHIQDLQSTTEEIQYPYQDIVDHIIGETAINEHQYQYILEFTEQLPEQLNENFEPDPDFITLITDFFPQSRNKSNNT